jgi:hypothetical protein
MSVNVLAGYQPTASVFVVVVFFCLDVDDDEVH